MSTSGLNLTHPVGVLALPADGTQVASCCGLRSLLNIFINILDDTNISNHSSNNKTCHLLERLLKILLSLNYMPAFPCSPAAVGTQCHLRSAMVPHRRPSSALFHPRCRGLRLRADPVNPCNTWPRGPPPPGAGRDSN